jgi:hypothetical protein
MLRRKKQRPTFGGFIFLSIKRQSPPGAKHGYGNTTAAHNHGIYFEQSALAWYIFCVIITFIFSVFNAEQHSKK